MNRQDAKNAKSKSRDPLYHRVMSGDAGAVWTPVRALLHAASWGYGAAIACRNRGYELNPSRAQRLPVPVISVGNITAGGTGKTPLVIEIVQRLKRDGHRPAVVSRGYRAEALAEADELVLVRRHCGDVLTIADADRVAGARRAIELGADAIVLDDAFQHRRIHRDLDIVVIDATRPFGYDHLLPRGLLREPLTSLRRADMIVLSRIDSVSPGVEERIQDEVRRFNAKVPVLACFHRCTHVSRLSGATAETSILNSRRVLCCAGVGNFGAFLRTVEDVGATVCGSWALSDHAPFDRTQFSRLRGLTVGSPEAEWLVVTEKDLVKMDPALWSGFPLPIAALAVKIEFLGEGESLLDRRIGSLLSPDRREGADGDRKIPTR